MRVSIGSLAVAAAGCVCIGAALVFAACVIAPPPDLPKVPLRPPRILHDSVFPPADVPLGGSWPEVFLVPILSDDPNGQYDYRVFVDFPQRPEPLLRPMPPRLVDGGALLEIRIIPQDESIDRTSCHQIRVSVAHVFIQNNEPDPLGSDSVSWQYYPSGPPYTCGIVDAGAGAPALEGSTDGLPVPPQSEGGDF